MNRIKKLVYKYTSLSEPIKASLWYTICNVLNKGLSLLTTPIFTRILTEQQYGTFAIFQSWYSIILIFTSLNIFMGGYVKGLLEYREDRDRFTSSLLALTTSITLLWLIIFTVFKGFWINVFQLPPILIYLMFIELTLMPALEFWSAKERFDFKYKKYVTVSLLMNILSLSLGVLAVINTDYKVEARVLSDVSAKAIFAGALFVLIMLKGRTFYSAKYWRYALVFNIPLIPHYLSNYVLNQSDRLMIGRIVGNEQTAYYSIAYTISMMMMLIVNALNNTMTPYIYKNIDQWEQGNAPIEKVQQGIRKSTTVLYYFVAALCFLTMVFAPEVIYIFGGAKYAEAVYVVPPVAISVYFIFVYAMFSTVEYYFKMTGFISIATAIAAVTNIGLNFVFIKLYGYYAAGYTTVFCYILLSLMHYLFYKKVLKEKIGQNCELYNIKVIIAISIILLISMVLMVLICDKYIIRYMIIFIMLVLAIIKRKQLIGIVEKFKR